MLTVDVTVSGPDLLQIGKAIRVKNQSGKYDTVPLLHKVAAEVANLCALSAQEAVVRRMAKDMNIRRKEHSGRFPSFIQNQVKITQWAKKENYPNIEAVMKVTPQPSKSNREGTPLILDILESGGHRTPFMAPPREDAKRLAVPYSKTTREGGTFAGKVQTRFRWDRLNLRYITPKTGERKGKKTVRGKGGIFIEEKNDKLLMFQPVKGSGGKERKLLYTLYNKPKKQKKKFHFFDVAVQSASKNFSRHFGDLIANGGDDRPLYGQFAWASRPK
jgi:hypothetical protein